MATKTFSITSVGGLTNQVIQTINGTGNVGDKVTVFDGSTSLGTTTVDASGKWTANVLLVNTQGTHTISANMYVNQGEDGQSKTLVTSNSVAYTVDTVAPTVSAVSELSNNSTTSLAKAGNVITETFTSTDTVTGVTIDGQAATVAHGSGNNYTATYTVQAGDTNGAAAVAITATDAAGNTTTITPAGTVTVDTVAPTVTITSAGGLTNKVHQTITGIGEPGSAITVLDGMTVLGTTTVANDGTWSDSITFANTQQVAHTITATDTDAAGNVGKSASEILSFTVLMGTGNSLIDYQPAGWTTLTTSIFNSLVSVSDANGVNVTQYRITDTSTPNHLSLYDNGVVTSGQTTTFSASDLARGQLMFNSLSLGTDTLSIQAFDGQVWSAAVNVNAIVRPADKPMTIMSNHAIAAEEDHTSGGTALSNLITITDGGNGPFIDTVQSLMLLDTGTNGGYFTVNGVKEAANTIISVGAADVGSVKYYSGTNATSEQLYVAANDGYQWGQWYAWSQVSGHSHNTAPLVTATGNSLSDYQPAGWTTLTTSVFNNLVSVSDANGDAITQYRITDTSATSHLSLYVNGVVAPGQTATFSASELANGHVMFNGLSAGTDTLSIQAFDGQDWGNTVTVNAVVRPAEQPLTISNNHSIAAYEDHAAGGTALSSLGSISGGAVQGLMLLDTGTNGGYFSVNGVKEAANTIINVGAADLASIKYYSGANGTSEQLYVAANNGTQWTNWYAWNQASGHENILSLLTDMATPTMLNGVGDTTTGSIPTLANFVEGTSPQINLDSKAFSALLGDINGDVQADQFASGSGSAAVKALLGNTVHLAYDTSDGALYYEASAASAPIEIAIIGQGANHNLHAADLHLV